MTVVSTRTYGQYCGLTAALDIVGQRWTLLIVRDLAPGPRRFTDLFAGLPGISTDLLTDRLRSLEAAGAVRQRSLRSPVPANLYELTDRGRELADLVSGLAGWGVSLLPDIDDADDHTVNARWALQYLAGRYRGGWKVGNVHLTLDDAEDLTLSMGPDGATVHYGHGTDEPLVRITTTSRTFLGALRARPKSASALPAELEVDGDRRLVAPLLRSLTAARPQT